jgi:hypothetical protein
VAEAFSYTAAWTLAGGVMLLGAAFCTLGRRLVLRAKQDRAGKEPT